MKMDAFEIRTLRAESERLNDAISEAPAFCGPPYPCKHIREGQVELAIVAECQLLDDFCPAKIEDCPLNMEEENEI